MVSTCFRISVLRYRNDRSSNPRLLISKVVLFVVAHSFTKLKRRIFSIALSKSFSTFS